VSEIAPAWLAERARTGTTNRLTAPARSGQRPVLQLYLGLFLAMFAFFVNFAAAAVRDSKAKVPATIASSVQPTAPATAATPPDTAGESASMEARALADLATSFRAAGGSITPTTAQGGRGLAVMVPAMRLFAGETLLLRPSAGSALDETANALASTRTETPLHLFLATGNADGAETIAARRLIALAAGLTARGAPLGSFSLGIVPVADATIRFRFSFDDDARPQLP
jgi:hypothetical protein